MTTFSGHFLGPDTHANRPSVTGLPNGTQYFCTTHLKVERVVSGAWADYYSVGGTETLPATIFDAKGDVLVGSAADAGARLAVGTDGQVLTADAAQTLGVKWATPSAGASGALTLLSTTTLSGTGNFDISSISGSYNDLVLLLIARSADATGTEVCWRFNNDSGSNYSMSYFQGVGNGVNLATTALNISALVGFDRLPLSSDPSGLFSINELTVFGYASTTWKKIVRGHGYHSGGTAASSQRLSGGGGIWHNTAAITRVQAGHGASLASNFVTGSQLRIYGRL